MSTRIALVLMGLLSVADIADLALTDGDHPPYAIAVSGALLGIASLVLVVRAWRGALRSLTPLIVLRILSAASAVPAFVVSDVPAGAVAAAAAIVALTALSVVLLARPVHHSQVAS
jgi:hypothetical protein